MKSTKYIYKVLMVFLLAHFPIYAQYTGGSSDGNSSREIINAVCGNPAHYYAYFGGNGDGEAVNTLINATCSTPPGGFAYLGGIGDGASVNTIQNTTCGLPPGAYAYTGGSDDGNGLDTLMNQTCPFPPQFYAYFGGDGDGHSMNKSTSCAVLLPVADFSASPTTVCVNGNVTLTDLSINAVGWEWTLPGATLVAPSTIYSQNPVIKYATAGTYTITLKARNTDGDDIETKTAYITVGAAATITGTTPGSRCGAGSVTIGATSGGVVRWYGAATGGTLLGTGATFTTPSISTTTTYYAEAFNGCVASTRTAVVATINAIPTITGNPAGRCDAGTVTISANPSEGTVNWYDSATGGTLLNTGAVFTTPSISSTTTYYAETVSSQGCVSTRIPVVASVNVSPSIVSTTPATRCGSGTVTISATASAGTVSWYSAITGGTTLASGNSFSPNVTATTTYYVETTLNGCTSSPRTAVVVTVNDVPTITSTTPASRCDSGSVTLQATASNGTLSWFNTPTGGTALGTGTSFTTPSISTSTNFYVESTDGTCTSTRTAVLASVNLTPSITSTTPSQVCDSGSVTLGASASAGTINWYNVASGGSVIGTGNSFTTPSINTTTTFYVEAVNGSCTSVRVPVVATVNTTPTITSTTDATVCGNVGATLSATASAGTIYWYSVASGGTAFATGTSIPVSGASYTFYVEAVSNGCTSTRVPVVYTNNPIPTITSVTPASRCDAGTVTLGATTDSGTISWYDAPTGGNLVGTGTSFTTPVLTSTTTYYVESSSASCTTPTRSAVTATVNEQPVITSTTPASRCGDGSVTLLATASIGNVYWYNAPTGGTLVATGGTFTTPVLGGTTTYYVEVVNGNCTSARTAVVATVYAVSVITSTTPNSRCDVGTLTLQATSSNGVIRWYDSPTGGNLLGTGTSFTTPVLNTTTTYYVESQNGDCISNRIPVTATIAPIAAPTGLANQTYCAGETVDMIVVNGTAIQWYDATSGGSLIPTGTPIVNGTTYYASQTVTSCESSDRLAVTMTLGSCLGNEEFVQNVIKVYPNPVLDVVTISSDEMITKAEVVNMLGQVIFEKSIYESETNIDMSRYSSGTYIIRVLVDAKVEIFKVIKK